MLTALDPFHVFSDIVSKYFTSSARHEYAKAQDATLLKGGLLNSEAPFEAGVLSSGTSTVAVELETPYMSAACNSRRAFLMGSGNCTVCQNRRNWNRLLQ